MEMMLCLADMAMSWPDAAVKIAGFAAAAVIAWAVFR